MASKKYGDTSQPAAEDRRWRAEEALRTIQRAEEIRKDKTLLADVKKLAQEQIKALQPYAAAAPAKNAPNALMKRK